MTVSQDEEPETITSMAQRLSRVHGLRVTSRHHSHQSQPLHTSHHQGVSQPPLPTVVQSLLGPESTTDAPQFSSGTLVTYFRGIIPRLRLRWRKRVRIRDESGFVLVPDSFYFLPTKYLAGAKGSWIPHDSGRLWIRNPKRKLCTPNTFRSCRRVILGIRIIYVHPWSILFSFTQDSVYTGLERASFSTDTGFIDLL